MFKMYLENTIDIKKIEINNLKYDDQLDDQTSVIFDICRCFQKTNSVNFVIEGFGSKRWPVDCEYDLPSVIEEIPEIIEKFNNREYNHTLGFYEQGVMRELIFKEAGDGELMLECKSLIEGWSPSPSHILVGKFSVMQILEEMYRVFISLGKIVCPELLRERIFIDWINKYNISYILK